MRASWWWTISAPLARMPKAGELVVCDELPLSIGGLAANASVGLARLGVRTSISGCVGEDIFGDYATKFLRDAGVDVRHLIRRPNVGTAGTLIVNIIGEDRRFIHTRGGNATYSVADVPDDVLAKCKVLYLGGLLLLNRMSEPGAAAGLFRRAPNSASKPSSTSSCPVWPFRATSTIVRCSKK
ncbi:MAG: PfkB family carbohydrate kinase [Pirellulales bacterium]